MKTKPKHRPSLPEAFKALCCSCCANYSDGRRVDCEIIKCPIYYRMPYRKMEPDYFWIFGKWTTKHRMKQHILGLTEEQYIAEYVIKSNGKCAIGFTAMIRAKCFRCCANFADGRQDCQITECPIYYWMPYREMEPTFNWIFDLAYTKKHRIRQMVESLTRNEYFDRYLSTNHCSNNTIEKNDTSPIKQIKFRGVK